MYVIAFFHFAVGLIRPVLMPKPLQPSAFGRHVDEASVSKESLSPEHPVTFCNDAQTCSPCKDSLPTPSSWQVNYGTTMCEYIRYMQQKRLMFYACPTATATNVWQLQLRAYDGYSCGRTMAIAIVTSMLRLWLQACYGYGYVLKCSTCIGVLWVWLRAYYGYSYEGTTATIGYYRGGESIAYVWRNISRLISR